VGRTIIEKIIESHSEEKIEPGKIVWMKVDVRSARDFGGPNVVLNYEREYGDAKLDDPSRTFFTFDLVAPAKTIKYANNQQICRKFARRHGVRVFDVDSGIGTHVLIEEGIALPKRTVVGTDSHMNILGSVCCFGQGMGDVDISFAFRTGKVWIEVPPTVKLILKGKLNFPVSPKDLALYLLRKFGTKEFFSKAIEFYGEAVESLNLDGRITLSSMITEMSGIIGFVPISSEVEDELRNLTGVSYIEKVEADRDANYEKIVELDIDNLKPQVASPPHPHNVHDVDEMKEVRVNTVFIGSCTNGRVSDIETVAKILRGKKIKNGVRMIVVPATRRVYGELLKKGILAELFEKGAIILNPSCGGCAEGHSGMTGKDEVQLSTGNRNFPGKQGDGPTYLSSPAVAAASAVLGRIASPEEVL